MVKEVKRVKPEVKEVKGVKPEVKGVKPEVRPARPEVQRENQTGFGQTDRSAVREQTGSCFFDRFRWF